MDILNNFICIGGCTKTYINPTLLLCLGHLHPLKIDIAVEYMLSSCYNWLKTQLFQ